MNRWGIQATAPLHSWVSLVAGTLLAVACSMPALAQDWPLRPVRIIVPFPPGGSGDILSRLVATELSQSLRQNFVVDNRSGAGGTIGVQLGSQALADGHTLVVTGITSLAIAPVLVPVPYDPIKSFSHIALLGGAPTVLVIHPSLLAANLKELIAHTPGLPKGLNYASAGIGTTGHLVGAVLTESSGARLVHVPYKGAGPALADLLGNHVPCSFSTVSATAEHVRGGRLRALAVSALTRVSSLPHVPTFGEEGFPNLVIASWFSFSGPAAVPQSIVKRLNEETRRALNLPDIRRRVGAEGVEFSDFDPTAFQDFVRTEITRWGPVARKLK